MPIITSTMPSYDPKSFVVFTTPPRSGEVPPTQPLARVLAGFAAAGLVTRLVEVALSRRPR